MQIDFIITELEVGGAERQMTELAIGLAARGDSVRVIALGRVPQTSPQDQLVQRLKSANIPVFDLGCKSAWQMPLAYHRLKRLLRERTPDIVQTFLFHANVVGATAAKSARVPAIVGGIRVAQPNKARLWLERIAIQKMQAIVCVSESVASFALTHLASTGVAVETIPNGIDASRFTGAASVDWTDFGIKAGADVVLYVGRLDPQKGTDWLLRAAPQMLDQSPSAALVLVGKGPLRDAALAKTRELGAGRAAVLPWQPDIAAFLKSAKLLVLPSRYEGMPNAVMEAMAAEVPIVCSDVEGVRELLGDQSDRQIVDFGDDQAMIDRVKSLLTDSELRSQVIDANRVRVVGEFSQTQVIDRYRQLYCRLAPSAGRT